MYTRERKICVRGGTASAVTNNVAADVSKRDQKPPPYRFAVVDRRTVRVVSADADDGHRCLDTEADHVTQVVWCTLGHVNCLAVTCSAGLIVYDRDRRFDRMYTHDCGDEHAKQKYARGIAAVECTYLCVGNSNGSIRVFGPAEDGRLTFLDRKLMHGAPVTDMSSYKHNVVSCDESGCTVLSALDRGELVIVARSKTFGGHPCTTTEMTSTGLMAVGYGCGTIRIFDRTIRMVATDDDAEEQLPTLVQVSAHARCITSMSAAKDADLLLTVSEDSWIRVWRMNSTVTPHR